MNSVPTTGKDMTTDIQFCDECEVALVDWMGSDNAVVHAMLVSTKGHEAFGAEATQGRINFLMKNRHGTPFEHNAMTFFVSAPIFVFREFHRHRIGFSYNEMSGRYRQLPAKFYIPPKGRKLVQTGKPGEYRFEPGSRAQWAGVVASLEVACRKAYYEYVAMLENGVAKEVARMCLPVNIYSEMFVTCNARSLMAFLSLRTEDERAVTKSTPMYEIAEVARKMEAFFAEHFPMTYQAFNEYGRQAP